MSTVGFLRSTLVSAAVLVTLAGCASGSTSADVQGASTLATTKPSVQLLRNEVVTRIATPLVEGGTKQEDASIACKLTSDDPDGLERSWQSSMIVVIKPEVTRDVHVTEDVLVASFRGNGWTVVADTDPDRVELTRGDPATTIEIVAAAASDNGATPAQISVTVTGPCVLTAGATSKEVKDLEAAD